MKIGFYVQGTADVAFVRGLAERYCPGARLAEGKFRGQSHSSLKREIKKALIDLKDEKNCDYLVVLTDADNDRWRDVYKREWQKVPDNCKHLTVLGVANRNIECWLSIDREALSKELGCSVSDIPDGDPSGFIKRRFGLGARDQTKYDGMRRVREFVASVSFYNWIRNCKSFEHFWDQIYNLSKHVSCSIPNERQRS